jgi:VIT1/CCC1 family predicted Fe2+/Mn2+ transporter
VGDEGGEAVKDLFVGISAVFGSFLALLVMWVIGLCVGIGIPVVVVVMVLRWLGVIT